MSTGTHMIADPPHASHINWWHSVGRQSVIAQQAIDRIGVQRTEKLAAWVAPLVFHRTCNVYRPGSRQRNQHMLIYRQFVFAIAIATKIRAKPMRKYAINPLDGLAIAAARQRGTAASRLVGYNEGKTFVACPRPQRCLA